MAALIGRGDLIARESRSRHDQDQVVSRRYSAPSKEISNEPQLILSDQRVKCLAREDSSKAWKMRSCDPTFFGS